MKDKLSPGAWAALIGVGIFVVVALLFGFTVISVFQISAQGIHRETKVLIEISNHILDFLIGGWIAPQFIQQLANVCRSGWVHGLKSNRGRVFAENVQQQRQPFFLGKRTHESSVIEIGG